MSGDARPTADTPNGYTAEELEAIAECVDFATYEAVLMGDYP